MTQLSPKLTMASTKGVILLLCLSALSAVANAADTPFLGYASPWAAGADNPDPSWAAAYAKAIDFVSNLTLTEKVNLTTGTGWQADRCIGNTGGVPRLGFRGFCLEDGPLDVRYTQNNSAFPAGINVAGTFSRRLMRLRGEAIGAEFRVYEPPLTRGQTNVVAKKGFCLESKASWRQPTENMRHYRIRMGFRRRKANVSRGEVGVGEGGGGGGGGGQGRAGVDHSKQPSSFFSVSSPLSTKTKKTKTTTTYNSSRVTTSSPTKHHHHHHHHHHQHLTSLTRTGQARTIPQPSTSAPGETSVLLDSGATFPTLWESDLPALGIYPGRYAAQSARRVHTADSTLVSRIYELDVSVMGSLDDDGDDDDDDDDGYDGYDNGNDGGGTNRSPLSRTGSRARPEPHPNPTSPSSHSTTTKTTTTRTTTTLSCTIPVLVFPGASRDATTAADGSSSSPDAVPDRLSGLLPFHMCYLSGAPGSFRLWMGDRRRDVLGAARLPGMMRYGEVLGAGHHHDQDRHDHHHHHYYYYHQQHQREKEEEEKDEKQTLARWLSRCRGTPERVIFEHELAPADSDSDSDAAAAFADKRAVLVLRDEDVVCRGDPVLLLLMRRRGGGDDHDHDDHDGNDGNDDEEEGRRRADLDRTDAAGAQGTEVLPVRGGGGEGGGGGGRPESSKNKKEEKKTKEKNGKQPALGRDASRGRAVPLRRRASAAVEDDDDDYHHHHHHNNNNSSSSSSKPARKRIRM
ncbi:hypothetical protein VTG60DRAFT_1576 [Thermothelomyces hinnuleus]